MFGLSRKTVVKASIVAFAAMAVSVGICLLVVPLLGGTPDGPGFLMSVFCPILIAWPASAYQFHMAEKLKSARDELAFANFELQRMHRELVATHAALQKKSRIDGLTGALNRETFFGLFEAAAGDGRPAALLIIDADNFKGINDRYGHQCGDAALRAIAGAIAAELRSADFWGRIGGEEFAIFLDHLDERAARLTAERIRLAVAAIRFACGEHEIPLSVSIGGVWAPGGFDTAAFFGEADRRLYKAKREGRNRIVMDGGMDRTAA